MTLWLVLGAMTALAVATVLYPLLRGGGTAAPGAGHGVAVYRDQLRELERDLERGLIEAGEAEAARLEIERRLLAAAAADADVDADADAAATGAGPARLRGDGPARRTAIVLAIALPLGAAGLYAMLGAPGLEGQPFAARQSGQAAPAKAKAEDPARTEAMIRGMVARLARRLEENPDDAEGWRRLGRSRMVLGEPEKAVRAYARAASLAPENVDILIDYGQAMLSAAPGGEAKLPPGFIALMRDIATLDPDNAVALWFLGRAEAEAGNRDAAAALWQRLLARLPIDAPARRGLLSRIEALGAAD